MSILYFFISFLASTIGAISGIGGGVIIKPVLDATGTLSVSTISFLSGCTVLSMAIVSLFRNRKSGATLDLKRTTFLGIGAAGGGLLGKYLFDFIKTAVGNENIVGLIQAIVLIIMTIGVFFYVTFKDKIKAYDIYNKLFCLISGLALGLISSFLGIGGGPINIAILYFFFSMAPKTAALNSIYIILLSQITSLVFTLGTNNVPTFRTFVLITMIIGGISGALVGSKIVKKLTQKQVDFFFRILMLVIIAINIYNIVKFWIAIEVM
ncbi:sulfite exporter TauE/SafE family protein [Paludicola sp. MB14-C6]|uniref:sulfite exporter TauE/SafE family protein n=1 Tax=Paludihabitans sp. MB14-C6 TaxID=3070656 RepID=UPI0027DDC5FD|nr:sulfite exporter TauE/SafE family protein [Paludicola sp. MB14-C6]WMJ22809.1 sulfite exporter TauE/SafE family protein [Paludicola sp. MB14-C6]